MLGLLVDNKGVDKVGLRAEIILILIDFIQIGPVVEVHADGTEQPLNRWVLLLFENARILLCEFGHELVLANVLNALGENSRYYLFLQEHFERLVEVRFGLVLLGGGPELVFPFFWFL